MSTNDYTARLEEILRSMEDFCREDEEATRRRASNDAETERREEAARRGELGEDWKKIQERIDKGETTLSDVFSGKDNSDEAAALRFTARTNISKAMQRARKDTPEDEDPFDFQEELTTLQESIAQRIRNAQGFF